MKPPSDWDHGSIWKCNWWIKACEESGQWENALEVFKKLSCFTSSSVISINAGIAAGGRGMSPHVASFGVGKIIFFNLQVLDFLCQFLWIFVDDLWHCLIITILWDETWMTGYHPSFQMWLGWGHGGQKSRKPVAILGTFAPLLGEGSRNQTHRREQLGEHQSRPTCRV